MQLEVTREAARRVLRRTGELYLWQEPVGNAWASDELDYERLDHVEFRRHHDAGIDIFVAKDLSASLIQVEPRFWPWRGIRARVDGQVWGRRGRVSGETGISYGGAGPP